MPAREELEQLFRRPHQYRRARIRHRLEGRLVREIVPEISKDRSRADFRDEGPDHVALVAAGNAQFDAAIEVMPGKAVNVANLRPFLENFVTDAGDAGIVQSAPMKREGGGLAFTASARPLDLCYPLVRGHQYFKRGRGDASDIVFTVRLQPLPAVRAPNFWGVFQAQQRNQVPGPPTAHDHHAREVL